VVKVYFCPKCKSYSVKYVFGLGNLFGMIPKMRCGKCGREGTFPLLVVDEKKLVKNNGRRK
jgi:DNA-directed RNA polymerase subunit M/transcription elongation factor TFIIS